MHKREIIVIGNNYASLLNTARALWRAGYAVSLMKTVAKPQSTFKKILSPDRYCRCVRRYRYVTCSPEQSVVDQLIRDFAQSNEKPCILPIDDYSSALADDYAAQLAPHFVFPHMDGSGLRRLMDKSLQKQLARQAGFDVLPGWDVSIVNGRYTLPDGITYPCFVKSQISVQGNKTFMAKCGDKAALCHALDHVAAQGDYPMLVERFADIRYEYGIAGFCCGSDVYIPGLIQKLSVGHGPSAGVTMEGRVMPIDRFPGLLEKATAMLCSLNYTGLFDIDLIESGGTLYFSELNLRLGAFGYAMIPLGSNLPAMIADTLFGLESMRPRITIADETLFLNEKVLEELFAQGDLNRKQYFEKLKTYRHRFIADRQDPMPYAVYKVRETIYMLMRLLGKTR